MTTIMKMLFSVVGMVLKLSWKIIKFLSGPMRDSIKGLWDAIWSYYKKRKELKSASVSKAEGGEGDSGSAGPDEGVRTTPKDE